jgi:hypothetical protein
VTPSEDAHIRIRKLHVIVALIAVALLTELVARYPLGLGDPPLYVTDPEIEYLYRPNQVAHPFGKEFRTNRYGMRSDDFAPRKSRGRELRVLVYGDSVVNGGNLTSQQELATSILRRSLESELHRPVIVGNVSAGSWGMPNQFAHIRRFGLLDADIVILVWSSHDASDVPTFAALDPETHPTHRPWLATLDGAIRYLPRYWQHERAPKPAPPPAALDVERCLHAELDILDAVRKAGAVPIVIQHWQASEIARGWPDPGNEEIRVTAQRAGAHVYQDAPSFEKSIAGKQYPFRDDIHPNVQGQAVLAQLMLGAIRRDARARL